MRRLPAAIERLAAEFARLPGVGQRTALRLAFHVLASGRERARALAGSLDGLHDGVRFCDRCHHLSAGTLCEICADPGRDSDLICVVEGVPDLLAIERTAEFRGNYHVLHGVLSPLRGIGPGELRLASLVDRVQHQTPREVILAVPISVEGEATASYIQSLLRGRDLIVSRIASGVPQGAELEYIDEDTLGRALKARRTL